MSKGPVWDQNKRKEKQDTFNSLFKNTPASDDILHNTFKCRLLTPGSENSISGIMHLAKHNICFAPHNEEEPRTVINFKSVLSAVRTTKHRLPALCVTTTNKDGEEYLFSNLLQPKATFLQVMLLWVSCTGGPPNQDDFSLAILEELDLNGTNEKDDDDDNTSIMSRTGTITSTTNYGLNSVLQEANNDSCSSLNSENYDDDDTFTLRDKSKSTNDMDHVASNGKGSGASNSRNNSFQISNILKNTPSMEVVKQRKQINDLTTELEYLKTDFESKHKLLLVKTQENDQLKKELKAKNQSIEAMHRKQMLTSSMLSSKEEENERLLKIIKSQQHQINVFEDEVTKNKSYISVLENEVEIKKHYWVPNDFGDTCKLCDTSFTFFNRKHHCRMCGSLVCNKCSNHRGIIKEIKGNHHRLCDTCKPS